MTSDIIVVNDYSTCDHCGTRGPVNIWLPAKYRADNWSPSSFSADELIHACSPCSQRIGYNHDLPDQEPPRRAWFDDYDRAAQLAQRRAQPRQSTR